MNSKALFMHDLCAVFFIFLPGDPYILKLSQTGQNASSDPATDFSG